MSICIILNYKFIMLTLFNSIIRNSTAYRSFIIEKHTNLNTNNNNNNNFTSNTTASRVKYAPPGQPATVLNTIVHATAQ